MTFVEALIAAQAGDTVARSNWSPQGMTTSIEVIDPTTVPPRKTFVFTRPCDDVGGGTSSGILQLRLADITATDWFIV